MNMHYWLLNTGNYLLFVIHLLEFRLLCLIFYLNHYLTGIFKM
nr:MAG TPA: hypothetical protein [Caudoviricetes sp.]